MQVLRSLDNIAKYFGNFFKFEKWLFIVIISLLNPESNLGINYEQ